MFLIVQPENVGYSSICANNAINPKCFLLWLLDTYKYICKCACKVPLIPALTAVL